MADELLTPGKGRFKIKRVKSVDDYSLPLTTKKGDRKVMLVIEATDNKGARASVFEHLTLNAAWKVELICKACNMAHLYLSSDTCLDNLDNLEGSVGECVIGLSEATDQWPSKTIIAKYIVPKVEKKTAANAISSADAFFEGVVDDEIPF